MCAPLEPAPVLTVVAGPNGAGKSTLTKWIELPGYPHLLDPDSIATSSHGPTESAVAIAAGREMLKRVRELLRRGVSFAVETTLSGHASLDWIRQAKLRGYEIDLVFVGLDKPERCIARIRTRAETGGHFIPDDVVRRRYWRSIANLPMSLKASDHAKIYDNSGDGHRLVLVANSGEATWRSDPLPDWVKL